MKLFGRILLACLIAVSLFAIQPADSVYASPESDPAPASVTDGVFSVTGYTVTRAGNRVDGAIKSGEPFDVEVHILDKRKDPATIAASLLPTPQAILNSESFVMSAPASIFARPVSIVDDGWKYSMVFHTVTYNGKANNAFNFSLSYKEYDLPVVEHTLTLNQCVPDAGADSSATIKGTGFVLKDARYADGGAVYAGEEFTLSATILATNGSAAVENVSVSFALSKELTLAEGSSVAYIGTMSPGGVAPVTANILPGANIEEGTYAIDIIINGINAQTGDPVSATATISVPVHQPERFEIFDAFLPSDITAGMDDGMGYSSISLVNKGRGTVANVSAEIVSEGLYTYEGKQYIGNVAPGEQKSADFNILADMPGQFDGMIVITYENARGEEKILERGFAVNVMEGMPPDMEMFPIEEMPMEEPGLPGFVPVVIIVAAAAVAATLLVRRARKRKLARAAEEADDDDDDDI